MQKKINVSFLIVNFNSVRALEKCLVALVAIKGIENCEVLIANNDEVALNLDSKLIENLDISIEEIGVNIGFGAANNILSMQAQGENLCFLNPDTHKFSENFLQLSDEVSNGIAIAAPLVLDDDGKLQLHSYGEKITPVKIIWENLKECILGGRENIQEIGRGNRNLIQTQWVTGAALMMSQSLFHEIGRYDEEFFLYYEDIDLCLRVHERKMQIVVCAQVAVTHDLGVSSTDRRKQKSHYFHSQDHYIKKHFGSSWCVLMKALRKITHKR